MGMFTNYHNVSECYVPNNLVHSFSVPKSYTKLDPVQKSKPYEEHSVDGDLIGYSWYQGETLNLEFNIDGEIVVESDAIIFSVYGLEPNTSTKGHVGQRAYNIIDLKSWTCTVANPSDEIYIWVKDAEFQHDLENATDSFYVSASDYLKDKQLEFTLFNFRFEPIYVHKYAGTDKLIVNIDKELSQKLNKGVYYCALSVLTDVIKTPIFTAKDCTLLVK